MLALYVSLKSPTASFTCSWNTKNVPRSMHIRFVCKMKNALVVQNKYPRWKFHCACMNKNFINLIQWSSINEFSRHTQTLHVFVCIFPIKLSAVLFNALASNLQPQTKCQLSSCAARYMLLQHQTWKGVYIEKTSRDTFSSGNHIFSILERSVDKFTVESAIVSLF